MQNAFSQQSISQQQSAAVSTSQHQSAFVQLAHPPAFGACYIISSECDVPLISTVVYPQHSCFHHKTCKSTATILTASLSSSGLSLRSFLDRTWWIAASKPSFMMHFLNNFHLKTSSWLKTSLLPDSNFQEQHIDQQPSGPHERYQTHRWSAAV